MAQQALRRKIAKIFLLKITGFEVIYEDERLTSDAAEENLRAKNIDFRKDKGLVDIESACIILEQYLARNINKKENIMENEEKQLIETVDEEGNVINFELFDIVEVDEQEYALLLPTESEEGEDDEIVLNEVNKRRRRLFV